MGFGDAGGDDGGDDEIPPDDPVITALNIAKDLRSDEIRAEVRCVGCQSARRPAGSAARSGARGVIGAAGRHVQPAEQLPADGSSTAF